MCNNSLLATDYIEKIFSRKSEQTSAMKPRFLKLVAYGLYVHGPDGARDFTPRYVP